MKDSNLVDLASLPDYRVDREGDDPRGWAVVSCDNTTVGTVTSLLVDLEQQRARYFLCDIGGRSRALPTAFARLDPGHRRVIFDTAGAQALRSLPEYNGQLSDADAQRIEIAVTGTHIETAAAAESVDRRTAPRRGR